MLLSLKEDFHGLYVGIENGSVIAKRKFQAVLDTADIPAVRPFLATLTEAQDGNIAPQQYEQHPYNPYLFVTSCVATQYGKGPCLFNVDVTYGNRGVTGREKVQLFANPCDQPWDVRWFTMPFSEKIDEAINPQYPDEEYPLKNWLPIENSLGQAADPPLQEERAYLGCQIMRNLPSWQPEVMHKFVKKVNSDNWWGFAAGNVLCNSLEATQKRNGAIFYWDVRYEFLISEWGWIRRLLDEAYEHRVLNGDTGLYDKKESNVGTDGLRLARPLKIDANGLLLHKKGDEKEDGCIATVDDPPHWLYFQTKREIAFSGLGLF